MKRNNSYIFTAFTAALILNACSGSGNPTGSTVGTTPSETLVQTQTTQAEETQQQNPSALETVDPDRITASLQILTKEPRNSGSQGETNTARELKTYFSQLGYETTTQPFDQKAASEDGLSVKGTNVIAIKKAEQNPDQADILVISAHHDGKPGIEAAIDDASGVAVMMEAARLVAGLDTDTELRFVSFAGEEDGRVGSRYYAESLSNTEKGRIIGDIQLDEIGYIHSSKLMLSTSDGRETFLGTMLSRTAMEHSADRKPLVTVKDIFSDHHSFFAHGIPSVLLSQDAFTFENHSIQDKKELMDPDKGAEAAQLVALTAEQIMSGSTDSLKEQAYAQSPPLKGYPIQKDTVIYFGNDRNFIENMLATTGTLIKQEKNEFGDQVEDYSYPIRWFGMEKAVATDFQYRNSYLETITVPMQEAAGLTMTEAKETVTAFMGEPTSYEGTLGTEYGWEDFNYLKYISLTPTENSGYQLMVMPYSDGRHMMNSYGLGNGFESLTPESEADGKLLSMMKQIFYPEDYPLIQLDTFSDGKGNVTGFTTAIELDDNRRMQYALDAIDILDQNGEYISYNKTVKTAVHEYGHLLTLNSGQVDISKQDASMPPVMFEQETFTKDAYMRAFYEKFWKGQDVKSGLARYREQPQDFVSSYAGTDLAEDIAESFSLFVLSDKPETAATLAEQKILFFYDYKELTMRRDFIRKNLGLTDMNRGSFLTLGVGRCREV